MLFRILARILRRQALFHLLIPLIVGVGIEALYSLTIQGTMWSDLPSELLSIDRIVLYIGIFVAYLVVITILIRKDTNIGLEQLRLNVLANNLKGAKSAFVVGTMRPDEWFDPAVQVYLATIFEEKLRTPAFRYERVLLFGSRSMRRDLQSDYLDGYYAKCLIQTHKRLNINLYYLEASDIFQVLAQLTPKERADVGFYPRLMTHVPEVLARLFIWPIKRRRVRKVAVGVIEPTHGNNLAFRFSKHDKIVQVKFEEPDRAEVCAKFVEQIKKRIYKDNTTEVKTQYDFISYFP